MSHVSNALPAWYGHLLQSDIGRINALFRKAHRWQQLTFSIQALGEEADIKLLGPLMGTLHTSHTNYYLHTDQLNIHYENGSPVPSTHPQYNILHNIQSSFHAQNSPFPQIFSTIVC